VQCWTPWPPPDPPVVWLVAGETDELTFEQAVRLADGLDQVAGHCEEAGGPPAP